MSVLEHIEEKKIVVKRLCLFSMVGIEEIWLEGRILFE